MSTETDFDAANQRAAVWDNRARTVGLWSAWREGGAELRAVRRAFRSIAEDPSADLGIRVMSLVNEGNAYDRVGRSMEALDRYDFAVRLTPHDPMARGNRGMTLARLAPHLHRSHELLGATALDDLSLAVAHNEIAPDAAGVFKLYRDRVAAWKPSAKAVQDRADVYEDPYAEWAFKNGLLLTPIASHRPPESALDPVHLQAVNVPIARSMPSPAPFTAINAIKRDYVSARFAAWLAIESPAAALLDERSRATHYTDTLDYARWDLRVGLAAQALGSAVNLADKIGTFLALWLELGTDPDHVNERNWCVTPPQKKAPARLLPKLDQLMKAHCGRLTALLGLMDMSEEQAEVRGLADTGPRAIRDAAVHRFVSVRDVGGASTPFVTAVTATELQRELLDALRHARRLFHQVVIAASQKNALEPHTPASIPVPAYDRSPG